MNKSQTKKYYNKKKWYFLTGQLLIAIYFLCACAGKEQPEAAESTATKTDAAGSTEADVTETEKSNKETVRELAPDLNRNGITEEVRLIEIEDGQELQILENGELVDREIGYYAHAGQTSIFLCTLDGDDYLLRYHPTMYQGVGSYSYELSSFANQEETVVRWGEIDFDINFGSLMHDSFEPEKIAAFMDEINDLLSNSVQLLNTAGDLSDTFEREGRLYDSMWWLDIWEPEFVRDESKSLRENLEEFRTAMTAVAEPVVLEEADGLERWRN